jgi:hypothetical protein
MPLKLNRYTVAIARDGLDLDKAIEAGEGDGYDVYPVTVLHADQLVSEQAAPRYGVAPMDAESPQKITWMTLWVWCALRRMRVEVPEFPAFKPRVIEIQPIPDTPDTTGGEAPDVDPTEPDPDTASP